MWNLIKRRIARIESGKISRPVSFTGIINYLAVRQNQLRLDTAIYKTKIAERQTLRNHIIDAAALGNFIHRIPNVDDQKSLSGDNIIVPNSWIIFLINGGI